MRAVLLRAGVMLAAVVYAAALDAATLRFSSQGDITTIDPHSNNEGFTTSYLDNIYEALVFRGKRMLKEQIGEAFHEL